MTSKKIRPISTKRIKKRRTKNCFHQIVIYDVEHVPIGIKNVLSRYGELKEFKFSRTLIKLVIPMHFELSTVIGGNTIRIILKNKDSPIFKRLEADILKFFKDNEKE